MPYDRFRHHRRSIRLRNRDYTRAGAYFVTIRTDGNSDSLGTVVDDAVKLSDLGRVVKGCWLTIPDHHPGVRLDAWVIMPDHLHGIVILPHGVPDRRDEDRAQCIAPLHRKRSGETNDALVSPGSLGCIIRTFKAAVTREINRSATAAGALYWQRNYHDRIIRNDEEMKAFRRYIADNPCRVSENNDDENEPV